MVWPEVRIESWRDFTSLVEKLDIGTPSQRPYLFRGQSNSLWTLKPSLLRIVEGLDLLAALEIEDDSIQQFIAQSHLYIDPGILPDSNDFLGQLATMQHYYAPTRLLDWTNSAYVAAYFACNEHPSEDGAIWYFDVVRFNVEIFRSHEKPKDLNSFEETTKHFRQASSPSHLVAYKRGRKSDRMFAQQGSFTVSGQLLMDHADIISQILLDESVKGELAKLIVPASLKKSFMRYLWSMNLTAISLFPGIDGLGRSIGEFVKLEMDE